MRLHLLINSRDLKLRDKLRLSRAPVIRAKSSGAAMLIVKCRVAVIMRWTTVALRLYFEVRQNIAKPDPSENTNTLFIIVLWS